MNSGTENPPPEPRPHRWPWLMAGAVVLAFVLAVLWVRHEVRRLQWQKEVALPEAGNSGTNAPH